jgi:hypothetical protein
MRSGGFSYTRVGKFTEPVESDAMSDDGAACRRVRTRRPIGRRRELHDDAGAELADALLELGELVGLDVVD